MTEYTATCEEDSADYVKATAYSSSRRVELEAYSSGSYKMNAYVSPTSARTFARGLLALADKIDGGEPKSSTPAIGDRVIVVENGEGDGSDHIGSVGRLTRIDDGDDNLRYRVVFGNGNSWWCHEVRPANDAPLKVGDRVTVVQARRTGSHAQYNGRSGELTSIDRDDASLPYHVRFDDGNGFWVHAVRRTDDAPAVATATSEPIKAGDKVRVTVENLGGYDVSCRDILTVSRVDISGDLTTVDEDGTSRWFFASRVTAGELERVDVATEDEPAISAAEPIAPSSADATRLALLNEARDMAGLDAPLSDVVALARFLAGE